MRVIRAFKNIAKWVSKKDENRCQHLEKSRLGFRAADTSPHNLALHQNLRPLLELPNSRLADLPQSILDELIAAFSDLVFHWAHDRLGILDSHIVRGFVCHVIASLEHRLPSDCKRLVYLLCDLLPNPCRHRVRHYLGHLCLDGICDRTLNILSCRNRELLRHLGDDMLGRGRSEGTECGFKCCLVPESAKNPDRIRLGNHLELHPACFAEQCRNFGGVGGDFDA
ncbi:hypothetical protein F5890DRAFT_41893 [Lentinula detonsa]|uniref:Uncharacterized protein n=1 Tax=Lentinula detonsa TaxID=2804962 RepID=A0AA38PZ37_9AGAR|nr:hypothetical protein F5890DRAFT_41893 [Lentinula detonsa]